MGYFETLKQKMSEKAGDLPPAEIASPDSADKRFSDDQGKVDLPPTKEEKAVKTDDKALKRPEGKLKVTDPDKPKKFYLTQSLIKDITDLHGNYHEELCGRNIYERYITKQFRHVTDPMTHGIFGESLMLGGGAKGQKITDLPRHKKTGAKLKPQLNIEEQAKRFNIWCAEKGISIIKGVNTQVPITKKITIDNKPFLVRTELDIFPSPFLDNGQYNLSIIDLKMTANVNSSWGNYCWSKPEFIDHIQADMAYWLVQDFDWELNLKLNPDKEDVYKAIFKNKHVLKMIKEEKIMFIYFIVGYRQEPLDEQVLFIHRSYREPNGSLLRQKEWMERARKTIAQLSEWRQQNWPPSPSNACQNCPVSKLNGGYCEKATELRNI